MLSGMSVQSTFDSYPAAARKRLSQIRNLIYEIAQDLDTHVEETLKWGEPAYLPKGGSTVRLAWKASNPNVCTIFVHCQTRLVETYREIYPDAFDYEGKRAVHIPLQGKLEKGPLRHCLTLAMTYHKVKHLPLLGA